MAFCPFSRAACNLLIPKCGSRFLALKGAVMIPVSRSSALTTKTLTSSRRNGMSGLSQASSDLYSDETLTYAPLRGSCFYQQDHPQKTPTVLKRAANYPQPGSRNKFQELLEADAVARAAMEASKRPSSVASAEDTLPQPSVDSGRQHPGTGKDEFTFAISVLGNRIKLSITPKRP